MALPLNIVSVKLLLKGVTVNRNISKVLVFIIIVVLSGTFIGCSSSSKKDSANKTQEHSHGGGCGH